MPRFTNFKPPLGQPVQPDRPVQLDCASDALLNNVSLTAANSPWFENELVYDGTRFGPNYESGSTVTPLPGTQGVRFVINRDGGWPPLGLLEMHGIATDRLGVSDRF